MFYIFFSSNINLYLFSKILTIVFFLLLKWMRVPGKKINWSTNPQGIFYQMPISISWELNVILNWVILKSCRSQLCRFCNLHNLQFGKCGPEISPLQLTIYDWFPSKHLFYFVMQGIGNTVQLCKVMCLSYNARNTVSFLCMTQEDKGTTQLLLRSRLNMEINIQIMQR